jgi:cytochrome P450
MAGGGAPPNVLSGAASGIPSVSRLRSLGDSRQMIDNPIGVFQKYTASLGDTFVFHFGGVKPAIVSSNPTLMRHVLKTNYENYHKSDIQMKRMGQFLGKGLLTTHHDAWRTQRRLIQHGFDRDQLSALASIMHESLAESIQSLERDIAQGPIDLCAKMMQTTFRMVARSLFSTKFRDEDAEFIRGTISTIQEFMVRQIVQPYLDPWFRVSGEWSKHDALRRQGDSILRSYIQRRRQEGGSHGDLLQILMDARYSDGQGMSDDLILSESMQLLVAGHETSSNALSWILFLLCRHPEYIPPMRQEFDTVLGGRRLEYSDVAQLPFTAQVISESLRLYPPFWMVDRVALEDDSVAGIAIPKKTTVIIFIYGVHHSARYWPDPQRFAPERFRNENGKAHQAFTYLPFGGGPRVCIGVQYAMLKMIMILREIVGRYHFELAPGQNIEARPMIILRPRNGIRMHFTKYKVERGQS